MSNNHKVRITVDVLGADNAPDVVLNGIDLALKKDKDLEILACGPKSIIDKLQESYDFVILDLPPVNLVSDALVTKGIVDGVIVVVRENGSYKRSLQECVDSLKFIDMNILGFVLTNAEGAISHYGINKYSYRYKKKYKNYYYYNRHGYNYNHYRYKNDYRQKKDD